MYEELVKRLRWAASYDERIVIQDAKDAADAIEELQAQLMYSNDAAKAIAEKVPRWIPVTERLPEEYEYVLCRTDYGMEVGYHRDEWGQDEWTTGKLGSGTIDVTHWMPLPEPQESEEE